MFVRCGKRFAINPQHVAYVEEVDVTRELSPLKVGLAAGIILELNEEEAIPLRNYIDSVSPLPPNRRTATPAKSAPIKKRDH